ncbi:MAG: glycosyltransferase [Roseiflexaceae bacterium]|nr:glycosyltransferase [Roseiflexaceae bacterium]
MPPTLALTRRWRYDVVHAHFIVPTGILAAAVRRISGLPLVITAHGSDVPGYNPDRFTRGHRLDCPCLAYGGAQRQRDRVTIALSAYPHTARL